MTYLLLVIAIAAEVAATVSLKLSEGFTKPIPTTVVPVGYLVAFILLATILKRGLEISVVYAIWSAAGVAIVAIIGVAVLGEQMNWLKAAGLLLVIGGVTALQLGGAH